MYLGKITALVLQHYIWDIKINRENLMKKILAGLLIGLSLITFTLDASAARLGGGMSFGRSMTIPKATPSAPFKAPASPAAKKTGATQTAPAAAQGARSMGLGKSLLIGAASALGFMALANMLGLGEGFAQFLMILCLLALALFVFRAIAAKKTASAQQASRGFPSEERSSNYEEPARKESFSQPLYGVRPGSAMDQFSENPSESTSSFEVPAEFDKERFLNMASSYFKMLQKAWDSGDMEGLANYCTDDLFISLTHKRREIKGANVTEILSLNTTLAGFETTPTEYVASVKFSGHLKENGEPTDIEEIWNLVKPREGKMGWLLAGIQQA